MRRYLLYLVLPFFWSIMSCSEEDIMTYSEKDYIQFTKYLADSSSFSFLGYPNDDQVSFPVVVKLIGMPSDKDREYKISVMKDYTDAPEGTYILPDKFVLRAGHTTDTCIIILKKTDELKSRSRRLTIRLEETTDLGLGQTDCLANIINISNMTFKPDWWASYIETKWLGTYSDKKYELFIQVNNGKLGFDDPSDANEVRACVLRLKNYLKQMKEQGQTVYEEDGTEMQVAYMG